MYPGVRPGRAASECGWRGVVFIFIFVCDWCHAGRLLCSHNMRVLVLMLRFGLISSASWGTPQWRRGRVGMMGFDAI